MISFNDNHPEVMSSGFLNLSGSVKFIVNVINKEMDKIHKLQQVLDENKQVEPDQLMNSLTAAFPRISAQHKTAGPTFQHAVTYLIQSKVPAKALEALFPAITATINQLYSVSTTRQKIFIKLRDEIKTKYGPYSQIYKNSRGGLAVTYAEYEEAKNNITKGRDERNQNKRNFERQKVLEIMSQLKSSSRFADECILVGLSTGARFIEVLRESKFEPVRGKPQEVKIVGVVKKRKKGVDVNEPYTFVKPIVGLSYLELKAVVDDLRKLSLSGDGEEVDNSVLTARYNSTVNKRIKELGLADSFHDLRKLYGNLSYELFADSDKITYNEWLKKVLGHESTETSLHYTNVGLLGNINDSNKLNAKVDELKLEVGQLEKRVNKFQEPMDYKASISDSTVKFIVKGKPVFMNRWRKRRINDLREQFKLLDEVVNEMRDKGIKVTTTTLRKLGVGGQLSSDYIRAHTYYG